MGGGRSHQLLPPIGAFRPKSELTPVNDCALICAPRQIRGVGQAHLRRLLARLDRDRQRSPGAQRSQREDPDLAHLRQGALPIHSADPARSRPFSA